MQWHSKASSLLEGFAQYGSLTEKDFFCTYDPIRQSDAKRASAMLQSAKVDLARVEDIFATAKEISKGALMEWFCH